MGLGRVPLSFIFFILIWTAKPRDGRGSLVSRTWVRSPPIAYLILTNMRATLKKPWRSPEGKLYPSGTMFVKSSGVQTLPWIEAEWYDFDIPGVAYGMVLIPNKVFINKRVQIASE